MGIRPCPNCTAGGRKEPLRGRLDEPNGSVERLTTSGTSRTSNPSPRQILHLTQIARLTRESVIFSQWAATAVLECKIYTCMKGTQMLLSAK